MSLAQFKIREMVTKAVNGAWNIPEFQREFVWEPRQVRDLVDSLYRDYPVGAVLLWNSVGYDVPREAQGAATDEWIVDGQQRTTALCIVFGHKPYWWPDGQSWNKRLDRLDVLANVGVESDRLEFALSNPIRAKDAAWVSVRKILATTEVEELAPIAQQVTRDLGLDGDMPAFVRIHGLLNRIWSVREKDVPAISVEHEIEDVAEIFARLNQEGTRVKDADVVLALVAATNRDWVRDEFLPFSAALDQDGFELEPGIFIRTVTGVANGTARLKEVRRDFWKFEFTEQWKRVKPAVSHVVKLLQDRGVLSATLLPSRNALVPLFALRAKFGDEFAFDSAFKWFLWANLDGRYAGSSNTTLSQDLSTILSSADQQAALKALSQHFRAKLEVDPDDFLEPYNQEKFLRFAMYLALFDNGAIDWVSKVRLGFDKADNSLNEGFAPQWHHIFARSRLKKAGRNDADINAIANITVMNEKTNEHKLSAHLPEDYIRKFAIGDVALQEHFIPTAKRPFSIDNYDAFVTERAKLLADAVNAYFRKLG